MLVIQTLDYPSVNHPNRRLFESQSSKPSIIRRSIIRTVDYASVSHPDRRLFKCKSSKPSIIQVSIIQIVDYSKVSHLNRRLSERQSFDPSIIRKPFIQSLNYPNHRRQKPYRVLSIYWLLKWNISKPAKALQDFIIKRQLSQVCTFYPHITVCLVFIPFILRIHTDCT